MRIDSSPGWTTELADMEPAAREAFLSRLIDNWEWRYRTWLRTDGASEHCTDPHDPITAEDFVLTLAGLAARRGCDEFRLIDLCAHAPTAR